MIMELKDDPHLHCCISRLKGTWNPRETTPKKDCQVWCIQMKSPTHLVYLTELIPRPSRAKRSAL